MSDQQVNRTPVGENLEELESRQSGRIKTLEQLLEVGRVDLKTWKVLTYKLNKWEVAGKTGRGDDVGFLVQDLWQVKATLIRRKMQAQFPTVQPVRVSRAMRKVEKSRYRRPQGVETTLIVPDSHFGFRKDMRTNRLEPFHDMRALDVILQVAAELRPHNLVVIGDILDLPDWSLKFLSAPDFQQLTQPAVIAANWWLGTLRDVSPGSAAYLLEGNHDKRLETAVLANMKAAYGLRPADELELPPSLSVPRLLALHKLGYTYSQAYPNGEHWITPELYCQHGSITRKGGGKTTGAAIKDLDVSVIFGHIHRLEQAMRTVFNQNDTRTIGAYSPGCICHIDGRVPGVKARQDWQQGFAVAHTSSGGDVSVQLYEIKNGRALFGSRVYIGDDRTAVLEQDTGFQFA